MWLPKIPHIKYGLRDIVKHLLTDEELEKFAEWAFGKEYQNFSNVMAFAEEWNKLHSDLFKINFEDSIFLDVIRMVEIWKEHGKGPV